MRIILSILVIIPTYVCATTVMPEAIELDQNLAQELGITIYEEKKGCGLDSSWLEITFPIEFQRAKRPSVFLSIFNQDKMLVGANLPILKDAEPEGISKAFACIHPSVFDETELVISYSKGEHVTNELKIKNIENYFN